MPNKHPGFAKARKALGLSEPTNDDGIQAIIDRHNAGHYTDRLHPVEQIGIKVKADIANSRHLAQPETMAKLAALIARKKK